MLKQFQASDSHSIYNSITVDDKELYYDSKTKHQTAIKLMITTDDIPQMKRSRSVGKKMQLLSF
jgi:hypothetical protein